MNSPKPRIGPRPLALHLQTALATWLSSPAALSTSRHASLRWNGAQSPLASPAPSGVPEPLLSALDAEIRRRIGLLLEGLARYRQHPYRRDLPDPPALWREGASRLLDYGGTGPPLLLVPSLVNRGYILDLSQQASFVRWLAGQGFRPYLMDWGHPGEAERSFTLTDYIVARLEPALDAILAEHHRGVGVIGYCMGGTLATALAARRQQSLSALVLMATPWDFHATDAGRARALSSWYETAQSAVDEWGELPVDAIQALFAGLDPLLVAKKFIRFAERDPSSPAAEAFVAVEDWLNDGVPLTAGVAHECLAGWYGRNEPAMRNWRVAGETVDPGKLRLPTLALIPSADRIVPPASAAALAAAIPGAESLTAPLGHIGMIAASGATDHVWRPLAHWLGTHQ